LPAETVGGLDIEYALTISDRSRSWSYSSIPAPADFLFTSAAPSYRTSATRFVLDPKYADGVVYVTILAIDKAFPDAFVLPSEEFVV
jgi:hypothetical protein